MVFCLGSNTSSHPIAFNDLYPISDSCVPKGGRRECKILPAGVGVIVDNGLLHADAAGRLGQNQREAKVRHITRQFGYLTSVD